MQNTGDKTALGLAPNLGAGICYVGNLICYFGLIYSIIVLVTDKTNKMVRFHAAQSILWNVFGLILGAIFGVAWLVAVVIDSAIGYPIFMLLCGLVMVVVGIGLLVMLVIAIIKAFQGQIYKIPVIGGLADRWS